VSVVGSGVVFAVFIISNNDDDDDDHNNNNNNNNNNIFYSNAFLLQSSASVQSASISVSHSFGNVDVGVRRIKVKS